KVRKILLFAILSMTTVFAGCEVDSGESDATDDMGGSDAGTDTAEGPSSAVCSDDTLWASSCMAEFFTCYNPAGTCSVEAAGTQGDFDVNTIAWSNGAEWRIGEDPVTDNIEIVVVNSQGSTCATGVGSFESASGTTEITFGRGSDSDTLTVAYDQSDNMVITCPDGSEESYGPTETPVLQICQGMVDDDCN
ncbi:MAG: hypothetical protein KC561_19035, partial [Myxococcales bacterium]|nr:hypothetical protein [Myxococcales bacterium]